ncbi:molybdenum cofactor biosynthesis protein MoaA [Cupriavidus sp. UYMMa02A]|nr:molybdenum cofactor biosynthesis protein MoaA [Cupriavidus sp. UYMU48A]ODV41731.1 molybdenum cofactor biosynthesis protein MoaA [Cupriavidus sp. UYMMa02A]
MKVLVRGLRPGVDAATLCAALRPYADVRAVELVRDGDPERPWAWVDIAAGALTVWKLVARLDGRYIAGCHLRWHVPAYRGRKAAPAAA